MTLKELRKLIPEADDYSGDMYLVKLIDEPFTIRLGKIYPRTYGFSSESLGIYLQSSSGYVVSLSLASVTSITLLNAS